MKTIEINIYSFDELSEESQQNAIDLMRYQDPQPDWYQSIYEYAEEVGLKIKSFDAGRRWEIDLEFTSDPEMAAQAIIDGHGEHTETYTEAEKYLAERREILELAPKDEDGEWEDEYELDCQLDEADEEFTRMLEQCYLTMLSSEWEYQQSDEYITEMIKANEWHFSADGEEIY